ncbi:transcriptional regulator [Paraglaciecola mesophila KMM 241]|uniref:Transcriptional regulator n=1 Tax=Paraglaciecola mesophila KMM 241 TaxID=1128912 RepID=K6YX90_9ALTE|nr:FMN-binding negative transcriptional regulator [Paraglaciecola mesophila]GAC22782.1 transcriptional regulator [Paraglaciecola mesophila KMM 241]
MFVPPNLRIQDNQEVARFISENSFGILVSESLDATHIPFIYNQNEGDNGILYGHIARANPHTHQLTQEKALVIFSGPHAYISPTWYEEGPGVPTLNYTAVHCKGQASLLSDEESVQAMDALVTKYEPTLLDNEVLMPADYQAKLRRGVVGFKVVIEHIDAKEKLGQQRKAVDQQGVFKALSESAELGDIKLANYMQKRQLGLGGV